MNKEGLYYMAVVDGLCSYYFAFFHDDGVNSNDLY